MGSVPAGFNEPIGTPNGHSCANLQNFESNPYLFTRQIWQRTLILPIFNMLTKATRIITMGTSVQTNGRGRVGLDTTPAGIRIIEKAPDEGTSLSGTVYLTLAALTLAFTASTRATLVAL